MSDIISFNIKTFKALSSQKRIKILKSLNDRQMTLSELSKHLNLPKSTLHENLSILIDAGLVKRVEWGDKFVYYKLSNKGCKLLNYKRYLKVTISFTFSVIFLIVGLENLSRSLRYLIRPPPGLEHEYSLVVPYLTFSIILISIACMFGFYSFRSWRKISQRTRN